jgi:hypothetical protein
MMTLEGGNISPHIHYLAQHECHDPGTLSK